MKRLTKACLLRCCSVALYTLVVVLTPNGTVSAQKTASHYAVFDLGVVGGAAGGAMGVNNGGEVVGITGLGKSGPRAFLWNDVSGSIDLGDLGSGTAQAAAINDNDLVVGNSSGLAFLWDKSQGMQTLGSLPGPGFKTSSALAINAVGQVVGVSATGGSTRAFLWDRAHGTTDMGLTAADAQGINLYGQVTGSCTIGGTPGAYLWTPTRANGIAGSALAITTSAGTAQAHAINDAAWVAGDVLTGGGSTGFLWKQGFGLQTLPSLGGSAHALSINNTNEIVGTAYTAADSQFPYHAVYWSPAGAVVDLNSKLDLSGDGWHLISANQINDRGWIAGIGFYDREYHAFLLQPSVATQIAADLASFQTAGQSLWYEGPAGIQKSWTFTLPLINSKETIGPGLGSPFGWDAGYSLSDKLSISLNVDASVGGVNINFPVVVKMQFPDAQDIVPGQPFDVTSSYSIRPGTSFATTNPHAHASIVGTGDADNDAWVEGDVDFLFLNDTERVDLFDALGLSVLKHIHQSKTFFDSDQILAGKTHIDFTLGDYITGSVNLPDIATVGDLDNALPDPLGRMTAHAQDGFFNISASVTNAITTALIGTPLTWSGDFNFGIGDLSYYLSLLQLTLGLQLGVSQNLEFLPTPHIHLDLSQSVKWTDPNGNTMTSSTIDFDAGQAISVTIPVSASPVTGVTPTLSLPNQFSNTTNLTAQPFLEFVPLDLSFDLTIAGQDLISYHLEPWDYDQSGSIFTLATLYQNTFTLGGFRQFQMSPFNIASSAYSGPRLTQVSPNQSTMFVADASAPTSSYARFVKFVSAVTPITVFGSGFNSSTQAYISQYGATTALTTNVQSSTNLTARLTGDMQLLPGTARISVTTGGQVSNTLDFTIGYPTPALTAAGPNLFAADPTAADATVSVSGTGFIDRPDYFWSPSSKYPGRLLQSFWARAFPARPAMPAFFPNFPFFDTDAKGNPLTQPGLAPTPAFYWNEQAVPLFLVDGSGVIAAGQLPAALLSQAQMVTAYMMNPGTGASNSITLRVAAPQPQLTAVTPANVLPGAGALSITVQGISVIPSNPHNLGDTSARGFTGNSVVYVNGSPRTTSFVSVSQLQADLTAQDTASAAALTITVGNPTYDASGNAGLLTSNALTLAVGTPTATITYLSPSGTYTGNSNFTNLGVSGTGFVSGATVYYNGQARTTTYQSPTLLSVTPLPADVAAPGTYPVTVQNPGASMSAPVNFTVGNLTPVISSLSPSAAPVGSSGFTLTMKGSGFYSGSVVNWNGTPQTTTFGDPTTLQIAVPASFVAAQGTASITVYNAAGGQTSSPAMFTIGPPLVSALTLNPTPVIGGQNVTGTVTLSAAPSADTAITLTNTNSAAAVPESVTVMMGQRTAHFVATTSAVTSAQQGVVTATLGNSSAHQNLTVRPIGVQSVTLSSNSVKGGASVTGTVRLDFPAAPGSITVALSSDNSIAVPPSSITIAAGKSSGNFNVTTSVVTANTVVTISATANGVTRTTQLTLTP